MFREGWGHVGVHRLGVLDAAQFAHVPGANWCGNRANGYKRMEGGRCERVLAG